MCLRSGRAAQERATPKRRGDVCVCVGLGSRRCVRLCRVRVEEVRASG